MHTRLHNSRPRLYLIVDNDRPARPSMASRGRMTLAPAAPRNSRSADFDVICEQPPRVIHSEKQGSGQL